MQDHSHEGDAWSATQRVREKTTGTTHLEWLDRWVLALTGLVLVGGFWRGFLGEGRVWIKGLHIVVGIASILPVIYYLLLASKHWKQLREKPWQRFNVLVVLFLLIGWFISGVLLWQFRRVGPQVSNLAAIRSIATYGSSE